MFSPSFAYHRALTLLRESDLVRMLHPREHPVLPELHVRDLTTNKPSFLLDFVVPCLGLRNLPIRLPLPVVVPERKLAEI